MDWSNQDSLNKLNFGMGLASQGFNIGNSIFNSIMSNVMNKKQWQREDTAYQRKMADMQAAGINPLMAINGAGASSSVSSVPQMNTDSDFNKATAGLISREQIDQMKESTKAVKLDNDNREYDLRLKKIQVENAEKYGFIGQSIFGKGAQDIDNIFGQDMLTSLMKGMIDNGNPIEGLLGGIERLFDNYTKDLPDKYPATYRLIKGFERVLDTVIPSPPVNNTGIDFDSLDKGDMSDWFKYDGKEYRIYRNAFDNGYTLYSRDSNKAIKTFNNKKDVMKYFN